MQDLGSRFLYQNFSKEYLVLVLIALFFILATLGALKTPLFGLLVFLFLILSVLLVIIYRQQKISLSVSQNLYTGLLSAHKIAQSFAVSTDTDETLLTVLFCVKDLFPTSKRVMLFWIKKESGKKMISGLDAVGMKLSEIRSFIFPLDKTLGVIPWVAITNNPFETLDAKNDYFCDQDFVVKAELSAFIAVPVVVAQQSLGVLLVETTGNALHSTEEVKILAFFASQIGTALENVRLYNEVELLSITDGLTGLYNHRHFQKVLEYELIRSSRYKRPLSLLMLDIDFFKDYNDIFGHPAGDTVLITIARIIQTSIRSTDFSARYGGEEFCVILTETKKGDALVKAEEIRRKVEECQFLDEKKQPTKNLTVSIGVSDFPDDVITKEALIKKADDALYFSKKTGRNRVTPA